MYESVQYNPRPNAFQCFLLLSLPVNYASHVSILSIPIPIPVPIPSSVPMPNIYAVAMSIPEGGILPLGLDNASASSACRFSHVI